MAGLEARLISNIIRSGDFKPVVEADLTDNDFQTSEGKEWHRFIRTTYENRDTYGEVPSLDRFKRRFPTFDYCPTQDSVPALVSELHDRNLATDGNLMIDDFAELLEDGSYEEALSCLQDFHNFWQKKRSEGGDISLSDGANLLREQYKRVKESSGMLGIPWPWDPVNEETLGMQGGQLIILYGRPKSMKTWVALVIAVHAYLFHHARVLFYSREMSKAQLLRRAASIIAGLDYREVKRAQLSDENEEALFDALEMLKDTEDEGKRADGKKSCFIISNDRGPSLGATVGLIREKAKEEKVDLLVVDAIYKLKDGRSKNRDSDWKTQANVAQDLKDAGVDLNIPVIGVTQANRKAATKASKVDASEVAFTDSVGQEADILMRIIKGKDETTGLPELVLAFPATRDEELNPILIHGHPGCNFDLKQRRLTTADVDKRAKQEDSSEDEDDEGGGDKAPPSAGGRRSRRGRSRSNLAQAREARKR